MKRFLAFALIGLLGFVFFEAYEWAESPASQLFGQTLVSGPTNVHEVALTFDDGPNPPYTNEILAVLEREHVRATFFVVGRAAAAYPQILRREARDGDAIGNHTWNHSHLIVLGTAEIDRSLNRTNVAIERATGTHASIMRPPFGARDWLVLSEARRLGYTPVMWSVPLARDWNDPPPQVIARRILRYTRNGSIIVLHDGNRGLLCAREGLSLAACNRSETVAATRLIIAALKRRGYRFVTIPQIALAPPCRKTRRRC
jgi:peptidoglycan/xylan/chitin deacetylase (PgdA/CDA1 family)